jgi:hypothetical protein
VDVQHIEEQFRFHAKVTFTKVMESLWNVLGLDLSFVYDYCYLFPDLSYSTVLETQSSSRVTPLPAWQGGISPVCFYLSRGS